MTICWRVHEEDGEIVSVAYSEERPEEEASPVWWKYLAWFAVGMVLGACLVEWMR